MLLTMYFSFLVSDNWDSAVGSRCLRHGLTVHTMLSVFPPYPAINLSFALKDENRIIVNTGNSLHVIFIDLEENNAVNDSRTVDDTITNDELHHRSVVSSLFYIFLIFLV